MQVRLVAYRSISWLSRLRQFFRRRRLRLLLWSAGLLLLLSVAGDMLFPVPARIPYSQIVTADDGQVLSAYLSTDDKWRMRTELDDISPLLREAVIFKEDKYFYYHPGVNPVAILRALFNNLVQGRKTSGASTITMQVARLLEPKERTYASKLIEVLRALQLEWHYSKDEILRMYLNLLPYGGNVEGVKAAALLYCGRMPDHLSLAQIVALSVIPNRPTSLRIGRNNEAILAARNKWLRRMGAEGLFDAGQIEDALAEPIDMKRRSLARRAPHLALRLHHRFPDRAVIPTRLNLRIQNKVRTLSYNYVKRLKSWGIHNAAALVIDNATRGVVAYLGSADFSDKRHAGEVDGVKAVRSPGSTLKPLVYALAIDEGLVTPKSVLNDVPINIGGYAPVNFNRKYNGTVTAEQALARSLNVPAVSLLQKVGLPSFLDRLSDAGFRQIAADRDKLGLSAILGGCGVRLEELAGLYVALANGGRHLPLKYRRDDTVASAQALMTASAAYMITEILCQLERPDLPATYQSSVHVPRVAWKTGTSYGRRDAWSIGFNKRYTIAVWLGNFSGEGTPELTGADIATPLLFKLFNSLDYNSPNDWFAPPPGLDFRIVCTASGQVPSDFCDDQALDYFIPGVSSNRSCDHRRRVMVAHDETHSYCTHCRPDVGYKQKLYDNVSPELAAFYDAERIAYSRVPSHNSSCTRVFDAGRPRITSPVAGNEYLIERGDSTRIMLSCLASQDVTNVYWFVDDMLVGSAAAGERIFIHPHPGDLKISCSDDRGRNADISVKVTYY